MEALGALTATASSSAELLIAVKGSDISNFHCFKILDDSCSIRGLSIVYFHPGIFITEGSGYVISGNHIGVNTADFVPLGNDRGISIRTQGNTIGVYQLRIEFLFLGMASEFH